MSSRSRLLVLVGLVLLGAGVYAIFALMREDTSPATEMVEAYLSDWSGGDFAAMEARVVEPPDGFVELYQGVVDELAVSRASYELDSMDVNGRTGIARYRAALELEGTG